LTEIHPWLLRQHPGLGTYKTLYARLMRLESPDTSYRAFHRILLAIVGNFIETYDEEPLSVDEAERSFRVLAAAIEDAESAMRESPTLQIAALNRLASVRL
jgi:hypothetical protein